MKIKEDVSNVATHLSDEFLADELHVEVIEVEPDGRTAVGGSSSSSTIQHVTHIMTYAKKHWSSRKQMPDAHVRRGNAEQVSKQRMCDATATGGHSGHRRHGVPDEAESPRWLTILTSRNDRAKCPSCAKHSSIIIHSLQIN